MIMCVSTGLRKLFFIILTLLFLSENCDSQDALMVRVITPPQDTTAMIGEIVHFTCSFSVAVQCVWFRRGQPIEISERYRIPAGNKENFANNCSLIIEPVAEIDFGEWRCGTAASSQSEPTYTDIFRLSKKRAELKVDIHPKNVSADINDSSVDLECFFSQVTRCAWTRRQHKVVIDKRYNFVDDGAARGMTRDCSIKISYVQEIDFGDWQCVSEGKSDSESVKSRAAWITQMRSELADHQVISFDDTTKQHIECVHPVDGPYTVIWEFRANETDSWSSYSKDLAIRVGDRSGFYRCSVTADGTEPSFVYYQIIVRATEPTEDYIKIVYVSVLTVAFVIIVIGVITAVVVLFLKKKNSTNNDGKCEKALLNKPPSQT